MFDTAIYQHKLNALSNCEMKIYLMKVTLVLLVYFYIKHALYTCSVCSKGVALQFCGMSVKSTHRMLIAVTV